MKYIVLKSFWIYYGNTQFVLVRLNTNREYVRRSINSAKIICLLVNFETSNFVHQLTLIINGNCNNNYSSPSGALLFSRRERAGEDRGRSKTRPNALTPRKSFNLFSPQTTTESPKFQVRTVISPQSVFAPLELEMLSIKWIPANISESKVG